MNVITHDPAAGRYQTEVDGKVAVCDYGIREGVMTLTHTYVPPELRGQGIAEQLVRAALADARRDGRRVVPACSYVAAFIQRHAEYQDLLAR